MNHLLVLSCVGMTLLGGLIGGFYPDTITILGGLIAGFTSWLVTQLILLSWSGDTV